MSRQPFVLGALPLLVLIGCAPPPEPQPTVPASTPRTVVIFDQAERAPKGTAPANDKPEPMLFASFTTAQGQTVRLPAQGDPWADRVVSYTPGKPAPTKAKNPEAALGKTDYTKGAGRRFVALGHGGELVLEFTDNVLVDGPGEDLVIFEIGPAIEGMRVAVSTDGKDWVSVGQVKGARSTLDIGPHVKSGQQFHFVRLSDARQGKSNKVDAAGADIDAVGTINMVRVSSPKAKP